MTCGSVDGPSPPPTPEPGSVPAMLLPCWMQLDISPELYLTISSPHWMRLCKGLYGHTNNTGNQYSCTAGTMPFDKHGAHVCRPHLELRVNESRCEWWGRQGHQHKVWRRAAPAAVWGFTQSTAAETAAAEDAAAAPPPLLLLPLLLLLKPAALSLQPPPRLVPSPQPQPGDGLLPLALPQSPSLCRRSPLCRSPPLAAALPSPAPPPLPPLLPEPPLAVWRIKGCTLSPREADGRLKAQHYYTTKRVVNKDVG